MTYAGVPMDVALIADLIRRAQQREPAAFDTLIETYSARLYGYFYRLTGSRDDAEDLLQEVFVRLVRTIERYEHDGRFDAWLFRIATNLVRDRVRRMKTRRAAGANGQGIGPDDADALSHAADETAADPGDSLGRRESLDRMQAAVELLPDAEREVIMLRHFSQLSFREIADTMGTPLGTALARGHRGLKRLRELMTDEHEP